MRPLTPRRVHAICGLLLFVLFVAVVISLRMGAYPISVRDIVMTLFNGAMGRTGRDPVGILARGFRTAAAAHRAGDSGGRVAFDGGRGFSGAAAESAG